MQGRGIRAGNMIGVLPTNLILRANASPLHLLPKRSISRILFPIEIGWRSFL